MDPRNPLNFLRRRLQASVAYRVEARRWSKRPGADLQSLGVGVAGTVFVDIFDTVLTRRQLGAQPAIDAVARHRGPRYAALRVEAGLRSGTLANITTDVSKQLLLDPHFDRAIGRHELAQNLADEEVAAEIALCIPVPGAHQWLARLRRAGKQVVFVSDMHLPGGVVASLLRDHGLLEDVDELVVSSDWGCTKRSGALFPAVVEKFGRSAADVVHVGNDVIADGAMARRAGLAVMPVTTANPTRFEQIAAAAGPETGGLSAAVGGAARLARLTQRERSQAESDQRLVAIATGVGGTVAVSFLLWVLERARSERIRTLYFVARDGEILLRMAQALPGSYTDGIELRYLHANRRTVALAHAAVVGIDEWLASGTESPSSRILEGRSRVPYRNLCERVGLSPSQIALSCPELAGSKPEQPLPEDRVDLFVEALGTTEIRAAVTAAAETRRALVADYFDDEGLADGMAGLVDVGWTGRLAEAICTVARPDNPKSLVNFHLGSTPPDSGEVGIRVESFLPGSFDGLVVCVETFTASGAAPVSSFVRTESGQSVPHFGDSRLTLAPARERLHAAMIATAQHLPEHSELAELFTPRAFAALAATSQLILSSLWGEPSNVEAQALSVLLFESDDAGRVVLGLSEPMRIGRQNGHRVWGEGSIAVSGPLVRLVAFTRRELRSSP